MPSLLAPAVSRSGGRTWRWPTAAAPATHAWRMPVGFATCGPAVATGARGSDLGDLRRGRGPQGPRRRLSGLRADRGTAIPATVRDPGHSGVAGHCGSALAGTVSTGGRRLVNGRGGRRWWVRGLGSDDPPCRLLDERSAARGRDGFRRRSGAKASTGAGSRPAATGSRGDRLRLRLRVPPASPASAARPARRDDGRLGASA